VPDEPVAKDARPDQHVEAGTACAVAKHPSVLPGRVEHTVVPGNDPGTGGCEGRAQPLHLHTTLRGPEPRNKRRDATRRDRARWVPDIRGGERPAQAASRHVRDASEAACQRWSSHNPAPAEPGRAEGRIRTIGGPKRRPTVFEHRSSPPARLPAAVVQNRSFPREELLLGDASALAQRRRPTGADGGSAASRREQRDFPGDGGGVLHKGRPP
jgi:hypothetical protein